MKRYYYVGSDNKSYGPILPEEFLNYGLTSESLVCPEGGNAWVPLRTVPGLMAYVQGQPQCPPLSPHGAPGYQSANVNNGQPSLPPPNYLVWAILTTIFCCLPFGIVAIVKASKVNGLWYAGYYDDALRESNSAKNWCIYSLLASVIGTLLYLIFIVGLAATI